MSDVKPYVEGQTGSLSDVIERAPDLAPIAPAGPDGFKSDPTWSQMFQAARPQALQPTTLYDDTKLSEGYAPIVDALGLPPSENPGNFGDLNDAGTARFGNAGNRVSNLATAAKQGDTLFGNVYLADRSLQEYLVTERLKARRAKDPNFLPGVPDDVDGLHRYFEQQQAKARAAGAAVLARGSTFGRLTATLAAGGVESAAKDPAMLPAMVLGGGTASSFLMAVGRDALINGVLATAQLPQQAHNMAENDEHLTVTDAVTQVASAAVIGAAAGGTVHLATAHVPPALFRIMPESVQTRWAGRMRVGEGEAAPLLKDVLGDMDNRELSSFARSTIGPHMTPDEKAAANVLERSQELGEASPFEPGPLGDGAHNANLATTLKSIIDGAPHQSPKADLLGSTSPISLRPPRPVEVPLDAGFETQWRAIVGNEGGTGPHGEFLVSPKGAIGPAQVMPGTAPYAAKLAGLPWDEARYRSDPAYNQALGRAYYVEQLRTFGDPDMAAAAYNAGPGSAERGTGLRGAMKRAAEHGEPGNWEAYLPHETQVYVENFRKRAGGAAAGEPGLAGAGADDELAALQRSADDAEAQALELGRERPQADYAATDRADVADVPLLKRELFGSDEQWADAQASFHASLNAPEGPPSRESPAPAVLGSPPATGVAPALQGRDGRVYIGKPNTTHGHVWDDYHEDLLGNQPAEPGFVNPEGAFLNREDALAWVNAHGADVHPSEHVEGKLDALEYSEQTGGEHAAISPAPLTRAELEAIGRPANAKLDALWYAGLNAVSEGEVGREPKPLWALRDKRTGEVATWGVKRGQVEAEKAKFWEPDQLELERLHPETVAAELRERAADQAARAAAADVRIDDPALKDFEPGTAGPKDQVGSLEHDVRMAAADPDRAARAYEIDGRQITLAELLDEFDRDRAAAAALRACAGGAA